ncbi:MAG: GDP-mannose 4,6-dehydratase, partial [Chloroflexota bacterium]
RRDLTYVGDTVDGFVRAATASGIEGRTIQLGTGRSETIGDLLEMARRATGSGAPVVQDAERMRPDASEVLVLLSDPAVARETLGWEARTSLEAGVAATVKWMRTQPEPAREATRVQL